MHSLKRRGQDAQVNNTCFQVSYKDELAEISIPRDEYPLLVMGYVEQLYVGRPGMTYFRRRDDIMTQILEKPGVTA